MINYTRNQVLQKVDSFTSFLPNKYIQFFVLTCVPNMFCTLTYVKTDERQNDTSINRTLKEKVRLITETQSSSGTPLFSNYVPGIRLCLGLRGVLEGRKGSLLCRRVHVVISEKGTDDSPNTRSVQLVNNPKPPPKVRCAII